MHARLDRGFLFLVSEMYATRRLCITLLIDAPHVREQHQHRHQLDAVPDEHPEHPLAQPLYKVEEKELTQYKHSYTLASHCP
jgi:hypothetical protein